MVSTCKVASYSFIRNQKGEKMRPRSNTMAVSEKRLLTINEASQYLGLGTRTTRMLMEQIGAVRKFGSRVLFDKSVIDQELDKNEGCLS